MSIELVMFKRDRHGNKMPQQTSIKSLDGEDISEFWDKHKQGPRIPKKKKVVKHHKPI